MPRQIIAIAAAPGWAARYAGADGDERVVTLLAWALAEEGDTRTLVGFVQRPRTPDAPAGQIALADEIEGFAGYTAGALQTRPPAEPA